MRLYRIITSTCILHGHICEEVYMIGPVCLSVCLLTPPIQTWTLTLCSRITLAWCYYMIHLCLELASARFEYWTRLEPMHCVRGFLISSFVLGWCIVCMRSSDMMVRFLG